MCGTLASNAVDIVDPEILRHDKLCIRVTGHFTLTQAAHLARVRTPVVGILVLLMYQKKEDAEPYRSCPKCDRRPAFGNGNGEGASFQTSFSMLFLSWSPTVVAFPLDAMTNGNFPDTFPI